MSVQQQEWAVNAPCLLMHQPQHHRKSPGPQDGPASNASNASASSSAGNNGFNAPKNAQMNGKRKTRLHEWKLNVLVTEILPSGLHEKKSNVNNITSTKWASSSFRIKCIFLLYAFFYFVIHLLGYERETQSRGREEK